MFYHSKCHEATARKPIHNYLRVISRRYKSRVIAYDKRIQAKLPTKFIRYSLRLAFVPKPAHLDAIPLAARYINRADTDLAISGFKPGGEGLGMAKLLEGRRLHSERPISARPTFKADHRQLYLIRPLSKHSKRPAGRMREIHNPLARKRPAIVDSDLHVPSGRQRSHHDNRSKWQCPVGGRHFMHVEAFAAGGFVAVKSRAIPRRDALFTMPDGIPVGQVADRRRSSTGRQDEEKTEEKRRCERTQAGAKSHPAIGNGALPPPCPYPRRSGSRSLSHLPARGCSSRTRC